MIDIKKLAKLTWLKLTSTQEKKFSEQLDSVVNMLDQIKNTNIDTPDYTRHSLLGLQSVPSTEGSCDCSADALLRNVQHPVLWHAIEVKAFVE